MKTFTLRGVPTELERLILARSAESGESLERVVIGLLEQGAGMRRKPRLFSHHDLDRLSGCWSSAEAAEFDQVLARQRRVEAEF